jgi:hypothetical protein
VQQQHQQSSAFGKTIASQKRTGKAYWRDMLWRPCLRAAAAHHVSSPEP